MAITAFSEIPGWVAGWDARTGAGGSSPTYNAATGEITSLGTELSGSGTTMAVFGVAAPKPKWSVPSPGLICLGQYDVATASRGMGIEFTLPVGPIYTNRKFLFAAVVTPANQGGDYVNIIGRVATLNNATTPVSIAKYLTKPGTLTNIGKAEFNAGGGGQATALRTGCERQVLFGYGSLSPANAFGYINVAGSKSPSSGGSGLTATKVNIGFINGAAGPTNGPFQGVLHAVQVFMLDTLAVGDFTEQHGLDVAALLASQWSVETAPAKAVAICGDSIGYPSPTRYDALVNTTASGATNTTLTANCASAATTLALAERTGISSGVTNRLHLDPGTDIAETVLVTSGVLTGAGNITISPGTKYAHTSGAIICNAGYGFISPVEGCWHLSKLFGIGTGHRLFNFSEPAKQLSQVLGATAEDGSTGAFDSVAGGAVATGRTLFVQRGTNDVNAARSAATIRTDYQTYCTNARAVASPPDKIIGVQVLYRAVWSAGSNGVVDTHNANLITDTPAYFDAVSLRALHPYLSPCCTNPATITVAGCNATTAIVGVIFDPGGVHPRNFAQACMALHDDKAYAAAWGISVGYAPALPTITVAREATGVRLTWTTPTSPNAPCMFGDTSSGASALVVKINRVRGGSSSTLVWIAPATINANTGAATYTTTYLDTGYVGGDTYTLSIEDAAANSSGEQTVRVGPNRKVYTRRRWAA